MSMPLKYSYKSFVLIVFVLTVVVVVAWKISSSQNISTQRREHVRATGVWNSRTVEQIRDESIARYREYHLLKPPSVPPWAIGADLAAFTMIQCDDNLEKRDPLIIRAGAFLWPDTQLSGPIVWLDPDRTVDTLVLLACQGDKALEISERWPVNYRGVSAFVDVRVLFKEVPFEDLWKTSESVLEPPFPYRRSIIKLSDPVPAKNVFVIPEGAEVRIAVAVEDMEGRRSNFIPLEIGRFDNFYVLPKEVLKELEDKGELPIP